MQSEFRVLATRSAACHASLSSSSYYPLYARIPRYSTSQITTVPIPAIPTLYFTIIIISLFIIIVLIIMHGSVDVHAAVPAVVVGARNVGGGLGEG